MMEFELDEQQRLLQEEVRRFAVERIRPGLVERDRSHEFPRQILAEMGEMGLLGMLVDEAYGGPGFDVLSYVVVVEEIARVCPSIAVTMSVTNSVCCWPIQRFGSEELKRKVLPALASEGVLGAFGLTEPESGSDAASLKTQARQEGREWVLSGEKAWITNAPHAGFFLVFAKSRPESERSNISAFVVPSDAPGLSIGKPEDKLGLRASSTAPLRFDDCRVSGENLLGGEGEGFQIALATLSHSRLGIAAQSVGIHHRAFELARDYAKERVQFGVPIAKHQSVGFLLAEMATELAAARSLLRFAALQEGEPSAGRLSSQAKLYASEAANRACYNSLQIHGGNGFSEDYEIARLYRDVRVTTIYEGTSQMQRLVIAKHLLR